MKAYQKQTFTIASKIYGGKSPIVATVKEPLLGIDSLRSWQVKAYLRWLKYHQPQLLKEAKTLLKPVITYKAVSKNVKTKQLF